MRRLGPYDVLGTSVVLRVSRRLGPLLADSLRDLAAEHDGRPDRELWVGRSIPGIWTVCWPEEERYVGPDDSTAFYDSISALSDAAAEAAHEAGHIPLHAASISIGGRGIALTGASRAGKSTLAAAAVIAGHGYLADEVTAVTADDEIRAFHRPLGIRVESRSLLGIEPTTGPYDLMYPFVASEFGTLQPRAPLHAIAIVNRNTDAAAQIVPLQPAEALTRLTLTALRAAGAETRLFHRLASMARTIPVVEVRYSDLDDGIGLLERLAS